MVKRWRIGAVCLVAALAVTGCGTSENGSGSSSTEASAVEDGAPIVIGQALAKTGWMKPYDGALALGAKYAADEINAAGGIEGHKIEFISADTRTDPAQGGRAAQGLLDLLGLDGATAERDHGAVGLVEQLERRALLDLAERRLAVLAEVVGDRHADLLLDPLVGVDHPLAQDVGDHPGAGRLAGPHEADEDDRRRRRLGSDVRHGGAPGRG